MKIFVFIFLFSLSALGEPVISPSATEGVLSFQTTVFMPRSFVPQGRKPQDLLSQLINEQTKHLMGIFEQPQFAKNNNLKLNDGLGPLGLGPLIRFSVLNIKPVQAGWDITYVGNQKILVRKDMLKRGESLDLVFVLPYNPVEFYVRACTDKQYDQKEYLFYYWNPYDPKCIKSLMGPQNAVQRVRAKIQGLDGLAPDGLPNYEALRSQIAKHGELRIALLFGFNVSATHKGDEGRASFERFERYFEARNFIVGSQNNSPWPERVYSRPAGGKYEFKTTVMMSASSSDINSPVRFARRARAAFENADIVMYVGHSGLGGNLNLNSLARLSSEDQNNPEPIHFPNAYQIFYLDSCGSFYFYSDEYALTRRGLHNVDIITDGTSSYFWTQNSEVAHFLEAFIEPQKPKTWTEILTDVSKQARTFSYLVNVNAVRQ